MRQDLSPAVTFLGFCGAPWTLASVLQIVAGLLVFAFVAEGIYLYFHVMSLAFGGKGLPLGKPFIAA